MSDKSNEKSKNLVQTWTHLFAGGLGGGLSTLILHPIDLIKVRAQVGFIGKDGKPNGIIDNIKYVYNKSGILGFYQGVSPNVIGNMVSWGVYMFSFHFLNNSYKKFRKIETTPLYCSALFAFMSGLPLVIVCNPIWVLKVRMCMNTDPKGPYSTLRGSILETYRKDSIKGFYRGVIFGLISCIHASVFLSLYEEFKKYQLASSKKTQLDSVHYIASSALAKSIANFVTYPSQVFRSKAQNFDASNRYHCLTDMVKKTFKNDGLLGMYRGMIPATLRILPSATLNLFLYEFFLKEFKFLA